MFYCNFCTPTVGIFHPAILDVLQGMVESCQYSAWFVAKGIGDIIVWVNDLGQG